MTAETQEGKDFPGRWYKGDSKDLCNNVLLCWQDTRQSVVLINCRTGRGFDETKESDLETGSCKSCRETQTLSCI